MLSRRILFFCFLALVPEQSMCAPLIETDQVATRVDDETVEGATKESPGKRIDDEGFAAKYLKMYGYSNPGISKNSRGFRDELKEGLKRMQKFFKLNVTGELDKEILALMNSPRCSLPDIIRGTDGRQKRFDLMGTKWRSNWLTYRLKNYPSFKDRFSNSNEIDDAIDKGLKIWTQHANLFISKSQESSADLNLAFYRGYHGDDFPFDGRPAKGNTLAHAFPPEKGDIHFDDDEFWSKYDGEPNLEQVTAHEGGHALGLDHSTDNQSIMYPNYYFRINFKLGDDDIRGIQFLYGPRRQTIEDWHENFYQDD